MTETQTPAQFPVGSKVYLMNQTEGAEWTVTAILDGSRRLTLHAGDQTLCVVWFGVSELRAA